MKKMRKHWMVCMALVLLLSVAAACSSDNSGESGSETATESSGESANTGENAQEDLEPVTFTLFSADSKKNVETKDTMIGKIHYDNTGVNWDMEYLVGDLQTKIGTMIASGEYPDVLIPDAEIEKVVDAGGFIPLNDLIEQHAPNIKEVYGPYFEMMTADDGNIYFLPFGPQVGEYIPSPTIDQGAFWIQRRVLKEYGYPKLKTLDEYFALIEKYVNEHPGEDLTGFTGLTHDWRFFAFTNPPNHLAGYPNDGAVMVDMETYEATDYGDEDANEALAAETE